MERFYSVLTHDQSSEDQRVEMLHFFRAGWTPIGRNEVARRYWRRLFRDFADYQFLLRDLDDTAVAAGSAIPIAWDGSRYPLTPMERYVRWSDDDGLPFDPWLRIHHQAGGEILGLAPASSVFSGTVKEWEDWTDLRFPESGQYIVPGALEPITIDCEEDQGRYEETNVWVGYEL